MTNATRALAACALATIALSACGSSSAATDRGVQLYAAHCEVCHGQNGIGASAPELTGEHYHKNERQIEYWIENAQLPMPKLYPAPLTEQDVRDVAAYVASL